ncbi:MAG: hypothetical protein ABIK31_05930 [candidate division WOR-3 bacterium]
MFLIKKLFILAPALRGFPRKASIKGLMEVIPSAFLSKQAPLPGYVKPVG